MNVVSLFSGIGGFDLGFGRAGFQIAACVEVDQTCRTVLARHFPNAQQYEDVRHVGKHNLSNADVLVGGFPCQDVSIAGRRAGLAGERSGLWFEFRRVIEAVKPGWVVIENVPGLLSSRGGRDFAVILRGLVECGYGVAWRILDSQYFGVPQRRRRLFIVGHLGDGRAAQVLFEREGGGRYFETRQKAPQAHQTGSASCAAERIAKTLTSKHRFDWETETLTLGVLTALGNEPEKLVVGTLAASGAGSARPADNANELDMVTVQSALPRRLTPLECERLQGFPDDWTAGHSDTARYKMLGNAVTVPVAEWIARRIQEADNGLLASTESA